MSHRQRLIAALVGALVAIGAVVVLATPASAHTVEGAGPTNYLTELEGLQPALPGVTVAILEFGNRIEVRNTGAEEVQVLGYQDEPYLRIGRDGVLQNVNSPAAYLNQDRQARTELPARADPEAEPEWVEISDEPVARWHDHRIHWMGEEVPPAVGDDPSRAHTIYAGWKIPLVRGATTATATGSLRWIPAPSPLPWIALAAATLAGVVAAAFTSRWRQVLAVAAVAAVVVSIAQSVGIAFAPGSTGTAMSRLTNGAIYLVPAWVAGLFGARSLLQGGDGSSALLVAGAIIAVIGGFLDLGVAFSSQVAFAWGDVVARAFVALCLGLGLGVVVADILAFRLHAKAAPEPAEA